MALYGRAGGSLANEGRNEIRVNNSSGKCLLENWVEEVSQELYVVCSECNLVFKFVLSNLIKIEFE